MVTKVLLMVLSAGVLVGCASQPNVYYTLTTSESETSTPATVASPGLQAPGLYTLTEVRVPAPVDDTMLVVRRSGDQLMKLANDRWTAPLGKQVSNALGVAMTRDLGMPPLSRAQAGGQDDVVTRFSVDVQRFDLVPGRAATLAAVWQMMPATALTDRRRARRSTCFSTFSQAVDPGVAPLVRAQQRNIEQLAKAMAQTWLGGTPPQSTRCQ